MVYNSVQKDYIEHTSCHVTTELTVGKAIHLSHDNILLHTCTTAKAMSLSLVPRPHPHPYHLQYKEREGLGELVTLSDVRWT